MNRGKVKNRCAREDKEKRIATGQSVCRGRKIQTSKLASGLFATQKGAAGLAQLPLRERAPLHRARRGLLGGSRPARVLPREGPSPSDRALPPRVPRMRDGSRQSCQLMPHWSLRPQHWSTRDGCVDCCVWSCAPPLFVSPTACALCLCVEHCLLTLNPVTWSRQNSRHSAYAATEPQAPRPGKFTR